MWGSISTWGRAGGDTPKVGGAWLCPDPKGRSVWLKKDILARGSQVSFAGKAVTWALCAIKKLCLPAVRSYRTQKSLKPRKGILQGLCFASWPFFPRSPREKLKCTKAGEKSYYLLMILLVLFLSLLNKLINMQSPEQYLTLSWYLSSDYSYLSGFFRITSLSDLTANSNCFGKCINYPLAWITKLSA